MAWAFRGGVAFLVAHALACGGGNGDLEDTGIDAEMLDSGLDATVVDAEADAPLVDVGADTSLDAPVDAPACECPAPIGCLTYDCVDGACVEAPAEDGVLCGEAGMVCVGGACVMRACGDGFREPGPDPAREACDDGNLSDGDACNSSCMPTLQQVDQGFNTEDVFWEPRLSTRNHPSVGVDDAGNVLVTYLQEGSFRRLMARRFDPGGVPTGEPFLIADDVFNATVVGLSSGWVIAYGPNLGERRVLVSLVPVTGDPVPRAAASRTFPGEIGLARIEGGFVVVFVDQLGPDTQLSARRFDEAGVPMGALLRVDTGAREDVHFPRVAGSAIAGDTGSEWAVVWESRNLFPAFDIDLVIRRFDEDLPLDDTEISVDLDGHSASVAYLDSGIGIAFGVPNAFFLTDVYMRTLVGDTVGDAMLISDHADDEVGIMLGPNPGGHVLSFFSRAPRFASVVDLMGMTRPELALLLTALDNFEDSLSHATAPDGSTWFVWRGGGLVDEPDAGAYGVLLFHLGAP